MLYIFSIDEQLQAVLKNDGTACPYSEPYHTEELNENFQNVFVFTVPADHDDAQYVTEGNLVAFKDLDLDWQLFEIKRVTDLHGDGLTRTAFCEHALYELLDDFIEDVRPTDCSATFALTQALSGTRWSVGTVVDLGLNSTNYYYQSALGAVQKVASVWGGELQFRVVVTGGIISARYVDLLTRRGADTGKQWEYGRHTQEIEREVDLTTVITAAYGRGKGVEVGDGYGRRLDFGAIEWTVAGGDPVDKPAGQEWVGDSDALTQWGRAGGTRHRFGKFEDSEETDAAALLQKTWDYLQANKTPRATYRMTVIDLERLSGYAHEKVRLGDTTRGIDRIVKPVLLVSVRVIGLTRNILQPEDTKITLGNFAPSLADEALTQRQINKIVSGAFSPTTGALATAWLDGIVNLLQNQLQATTTKFYTDANGAFIWEAIDGSSAMKIAGGVFALANAKIIDTQEWDWQTFGDGNGFTANMLNAGQIRTSLIKIFGNTEFYWDGDNLYIINPANLNEQIRLSKEGIRFTQDGGQTWNVAIGFSGIRMIGKSEDESTEYSSDGVRVYNDLAQLMAHLGSFEALGPVVAAFTRASTAYLSDGTLVASGVPRYEAGETGFGSAIMCEEGTVNLLSANQASVETDTTGFSTTGLSATISRSNTWSKHGAYSLKVITGDTASGFFVNPGVSGTAGQPFIGSFTVKGANGVNVDTYLYDVTNAVVLGRQTVGVTADEQVVTTVPGATLANNSANIRLYVRFDTAGTYYADCMQIEQKAYATSWQLPGTTRAAEVLTVPTSGVLTDAGPWTIECRAKTDHAGINYRMLFSAWDKFYVALNSADKPQLSWMDASDVQQTAIATNVLSDPTGRHYWVFAWDGTTARVYVDAVKVIEVATDFPKSLPANLYIGNLSGSQYFWDGLIDDLRLSNIARTDQEIADAYASGEPLRVDANTTLKMGFDGTLQTTVRDYGAYLKNGRFILQDPATGQGIEVWDGAVRKVLIGRLDDGTIGQEIVGGALYSSLFRTGAKTDTNYIELVPPNTFRVVNNGQTTLEITAGGNNGVISLFDGGTEYLQAYAAYSLSSVMHGVLRALNNRPLALVGPAGTGQVIKLGTAGNISINATDEIRAIPGTGNYFVVEGNLSATGAKPAQQLTDSFGRRLLYANESPEVKYSDERYATMENGLCILDMTEIDPCFLECIEPCGNTTPWFTYLTPTGPFTPYLFDIRESYIVIKSKELGINGKFIWQLSATRKGYAEVRLEEMYAEGELLTTDWEDDLLL